MHVPAAVGPLREALLGRPRFDAAVFGLLLLFALCSSFSIALTQIAYFSALLLWTGRMIARRRSAWPRTPFDLFFLAYAGAEILATVFSVAPLYSLLYLQRRLLLLPLVYLLTAQLQTIRDAKIFLAVLALSCVAAAVYSLGPLFRHLTDYLLFRRRLATFQNYMTTGGIQMIMILLLVPFLVHRKTPGRIRLLAALALVPMLINLVFTFTRSAWLGTIAGVMLISLFRAPRLLLALAAVMAAVYLFSSPEVRYARIESMFDPHHPLNATRLVMWKAGWEAFLDHPLVGVGDIGMETIWDRYAEPGWDSEGHLHNNLLMWAVTLGSLGLAVLVAFFVKAWIVAMRVARRAREDWFGGSVAVGALAAMAGFHVAGLFEWNFGDAEISMLLWSILALVLVVGREAPAAGETAEGAAVHGRLGRDRGISPARPTRAR